MKSGSSSTWPSSREPHHSWWDSAEHPVTHWLFSLLLKQEGFGQKTSLANSSPPLHAGFQISCLDLLSGNVDLFFTPRRVSSFPFPLSWSLPDYREEKEWLYFAPGSECTSARGRRTNPPLEGLSPTLQSQLLRDNALGLPPIRHCPGHIPPRGVQGQKKVICLEELTWV